MTHHIFYNHQCSKCQAHYIPFKRGIVCPSCGIAENDFFDFIPQAKFSMQFNQKVFNSYIPPAWYTSSLGDHVLLTLFYLFENHKASNEPFEKFSNEFLSRKDWKDQKYLEKHIYEISLELYKALMNKDLLKDSEK
ncbi:MAG: hypothetical protein JXA60_08115 [Candidatus Coatesbacteria bacterium]|nr:hypothetical protein [Candidatus Coatesbacteria bacterium]